MHLDDRLYEQKANQMRASVGKQTLRTYQGRHCSRCQGGCDDQNKASPLPHQDFVPKGQKKPEYYLDLYFLYYSLVHSIRSRAKR